MNYSSKLMLAIVAQDNTLALKQLLLKENATNETSNGCK